MDGALASIFPIEVTLPTAADIAARFALTPVQAARLEHDSRIVYDYFGPLTTLISADMVDDLLLAGEADPRHRALCLGRDGHFLAAAIRGLDSRFFTAHAGEASLSRMLVEASLQDLENNRGMTFPQLDGIRTRRAKVDPADIPGAFDRLCEVLSTAGMPVGAGPRDAGPVGVSFLDVGILGSVGEMVHAMFPSLEVFGRYVVCETAPGDPRPWAKKGYLGLPVHDASDSTRLPDLPSDPAHTFVSYEGLRFFDLLRGPLTSPVRYDELGPAVRLQHSDPTSLSGLTGQNPVRVAGEYQDPRYRDALRTAFLLVTYEHARDTARRRAAGEPWREDLEAGRRRLEDQAFRWIHRLPGVEPRLQLLADSFVRRVGHDKINKRLNLAMAAATDLAPGRRRTIWRGLEDRYTLDVQTQYVSEALADLDRSTPAGRPTGRRRPPGGRGR